MAIKRQLYVGLLSLTLLTFISNNGALYAENNADADVVNVEAIDNGDNGWTFNVTVLHPDTGWDDYCNGWDVVTDKGEILKRNPSDEFTRLLLHPHETEQPFTRSQRGLIIPNGVQKLTVRAHDLLFGFGGKEVLINLSVDHGEGYKIIRH